MKVLVTGGGGFLGSWVCRALLARGDSVRSLQRSAIPELVNEGVEEARGDMADAAAVTAAVEGVDAVIHVAGGAEDEVAFLGGHAVPSSGEGVRRGRVAGR